MGIHHVTLVYMGAEEVFPASSIWALPEVPLFDRMRFSNQLATKLEYYFDYISPVQLLLQIWEEYCAATGCITGEMILVSEFGEFSTITDPSGAVSFYVK